MRVLIALLAFCATALTQTITNATGEYTLRTCLKDGQLGKERFEGLTVFSYHTGAGLGDATVIELADNATYIPRGFLSPVVNSTVENNYHQAFNFGNAFPWQMVIAQNVAFYADWQPVRINTGLGDSRQGTTEGFFLNETGLQWTSSPGRNVTSAFGGWLVCDWWHGVPQLFFRISYYRDTPAPCSCADVNLMPVYL